MPRLGRLANLAVELIDPRGRCDRKGLLVLAVLLLVLQAALALAQLIGGFDLESTAGTAAKAVFLYMACAATGKRLHDTGRTAWWILGVIAAVVIWTIGLSIAAALSLGPDALEPDGFWSMAILTATCLPVLGLLMWLHVAKGQTCPNRYGPVPRGWGLPRHRQEPTVAADPSMAQPV